MAKSALIVVDMQRDFCEGGALAAAGTLSLLGPLKECIEAAREHGATIVYTQDWHPVGHSSFQTNGGPWPIHCVAGSAGAELMPPLEAVGSDVVIHKGVSEEGAAYSGFDQTELAQRLHELKIERVAVCGVATEYCVKATALDAVKEGFETELLTDLVRGVQPSETERALSELRAAGAKTTTSGEWLRDVEAGALRQRA